MYQTAKDIKLQKSSGKQPVVNKQSSKTLRENMNKIAEGSREWNDRYMNMSKMIRRWQLAFFVSMIAVVVLAIIVVKITTESKVQNDAISQAETQVIIGAGSTVVPAYGSSGHSLNAP